MDSPYDCITDFLFVETPLEAADVILIPGGSHPQLMERAADLYLQGLAPYLLPSGGPNPKLPNHPSEWAFLRDLALRRGVPESAILKEEKAANTFENAAFSLAVLREQAASAGLSCERVILVCKAYHSRRALLTYQHVFPASTRFFVSPVIDLRGISRQNWFNNPAHIAIVMGEVRKIGEYFEDKISSFR